MTEGLNYISVRIYREDGKGGIPIKGSGTLFEDNGCHYVLTAYHCLENKLEDGTKIPLDLSKTNIAIRINRKDVKVDIEGIVDGNQDTDWALLKVRKPQVDWDYKDKVRLTRQISIHTPYESYPYVTAYGGSGRYTEVVPENDEGYCHISDSVSGGRLYANIVMQGGSGAGIMLNKGGVLYCFGFMKETLPGGQLNDIIAVCVDDVIPLLSRKAGHTLTEQEQQELRTDKIESQKTLLEQNLSQAKTKEELCEIVKKLVTSTIPSLINNLLDELAHDLLDVIEQHCRALFTEDKRLYSQYLFCKGQYYRLLSDSGAAKNTFHKAYELDDSEQNLRSIEARRLWRDGKHDEALVLAETLPEEHELRIAMHVASSNNPEQEFGNVAEEMRNCRLRYRISELLGQDKGMPLWLMNGIDIKEPETLTLENLPDWMFLFTCIHYQVQGVIPMRFEDFKLGDMFPKAFYASKKYFTLAKGTKLENAIPFLEALHCYWGFLVEQKDVWLERYHSIDFSKEEEDKQIYGHVLYSSMLTLKGQYDAAYKNIASRELPISDLIFLFVSVLCCVSRKIAYMISLIEKYKDTISLNQGVDSAFVQMAEVFHPSEFEEVLKRIQYSDDIRPRLLKDYNCLIFHHPYNTEGYVGWINELHGDMAAIAGLLLFYSGEKENAVNYLKEKIEQGEHNACESTYYKLIAQDGAHRPEYFEHLQALRKSGDDMSENQLREEYNFSLILQDYDNALEVIELIWQRNKNDEWANAAYITMLGRKRKEAVRDMISQVMGMKFTRPNHIQSVYYALATNEYTEEAAQFLYTHTLSLQDEGLSAFYNQQTIMGYIAGVANIQHNEVIDGSYVLYTTDGKDRLCRKVTAGTMFGDSMMGYHKDDELTLILSDEERHIRILGIFNKYYYLHYKTMKEVVENGGNEYFTPFHIETPEGEEGAKELLRFLEKMAGGDERKEAIERYKRGELGLIHFVDDNEVFSSYYDMLFTDFPRLSIPYKNYIISAPELFTRTCSYVLDVTSLLLLYEFSLSYAEWEPKRKFLLPKLIRELVAVQVKASLRDIGAGLHKAMSTGKLYRFDKDYGVNLEKRFKNLEKWIENHCELVASQEILKIEQPNNAADTAKGKLLTYTLVELLNNNPMQLRVLVSEDYFYSNLCGGIKLPLISTESYMYKVEGLEWGTKFTEFITKVKEYESK